MLPHWGLPPTCPQDKSWFAHALVPDVLIGLVDGVVGWTMSIQWDTTVIDLMLSLQMLLVQEEVIRMGSNPTVNVLKRGQLDLSVYWVGSRLLLGQGCTGLAGRSGEKPKS